MNATWVLVGVGVVLIAVFVIGAMKYKNNISSHLATLNPHTGAVQFPPHIQHIDYLSSQLNPKTGNFEIPLMI